MEETLKAELFFYGRIGHSLAEARRRLGVLSRKVLFEWSSGILEILGCW